MISIRSALTSAMRSLPLVALAAITLGAQPKPTVPAKVPPAAAAAVAGGLIDINRATPAELEGIPGIGKAFAAKIVGGRPYANKAQLVQKNILSAALYEKIKDRIIAKQ